jgi:hypothetical protein
MGRVRAKGFGSVLKLWRSSGVISDTISEINGIGSFNITIPRSERPVAEIVSRVPRAFRDQAEKGFVVLAEVAKQHYAEILKAVVIALAARGETPS